MKRFVRRTSAIVAVASLFMATTAQAATPSVPSSASAWSTLAFLNGGQSAAAYCGSTAVAAAGAAAQGAVGGCVLPVLDPVPAPAVQSSPVLDQAVPPPLPGAASGVSVSSISPLMIALGALAAAAVAYLLIHGLGNGGSDNSPA